MHGSGRFDRQLASEGRLGRQVAEGRPGVAGEDALIEFAGGLGAEIDARLIPRSRAVKRDDDLLFSESNTRFVVEVDAACEKDFRIRFKGLPCKKAGEVTKKKKLVVTGLGGKPVISAGVDRLKKVWQVPLAW